MALVVNRITVTVRRPGGVDRHGDKLPGSEHTIADCVLAPVSSRENEDRRDQVVTELRLYPPYGADLTATDTVVVPGGDEYTVEGQPSRWASPFTTWTPGQEVTLRKVRG